MRKILLVEPAFPIPYKSKNHAHFLPVGLLKIGSYHKSIGDKVQLVRGDISKKSIHMYPDDIFITSLFTYWSKYVVQSVAHYRNLYPKAKITVGGIFASLMSEQCKKITMCDDVHVGLYLGDKTENIKLDYTLLDEEIDYQIIHTSRGCFRKCTFCGTWKIEPNITYKDSILGEIKKNNLIIYDNNLLANPNIENILLELSDFKFKNRNINSESQSGLDGRILLKKPHLAIKLKKAHFINPRIAWDHSYKQWRMIKKQIYFL